MYGVQSSEMCIACASTHAPNTRPQYHYAPCHEHKSLHLASHRDHGETKGQKQSYYLPNSSTTPKTVFGIFPHPLKYGVALASLPLTLVTDCPLVIWILLLMSDSPSSPQQIFHDWKSMRYWSIP